MTDTQVSIAPPHNLEAEEAVIGSVLIDPEMFSEIPALQPGDFYIVRHRWIWESFVALNRKNSPIDLLTVTEELERQQRLTETGGPSYLTRLCTITPTAYNAPAYAGLVKECSLRRQGLNAVSEIAKLMYDAGTDVTASLGEGAAMLDGLAPATGTNTDAMDTALEWESEITDRINGVTPNAISSGYRAIDEKTTGGGKRGEVVVLAALPSMGKTSLFAQMACRQSSPAMGYRVGIFSQEMRKVDIVEIMALSRMNRSVESLTADDFEEISRVVTEIGQQTFMVNDVSGLTVAEIGRQARDMKRQMRGLDVLYIDHLGYIIHAGKKGENKAALIGNTMKGLMRLAKQMNILIVVLCQLARSDKYSADNPPELTDLRESGDIEADARQVWILHRKDYFADLETAVPKDEPQTANVIIRKNHKGPRNVAAYLSYIDATRQFSETYNLDAGPANRSATRPLLFEGASEPADLPYDWTDR